MIWEYSHVNIAEEKGLITLFIHKVHMYETHYDIRICTCKYIPEATAHSNVHSHNRVIVSFLQQVQGGTRPTAEGSRENIGHNVHV